MGGGSGAEAADGSAGAEAVLHVTAVEPGSPSAAVGLVPGDDYVLASLQGGAYEDVDSFGDDVGDALLKYQAAAAGTGAGAGAASPPAVLLPLFVYRTSTDSVRLVQLPVRDAGWGAGGERHGLGLELACGKFHELPAASLLTDGRAEFEVQAQGPPAVQMSRFLAEAETPSPPDASAGATAVAVAAAAAASASASAAAAAAVAAAAPELALAPSSQQAAARAAPPLPALTPFGSTNPAPQRSLAGPSVLMQARGSAHLQGAGTGIL